MFVDQVGEHLGAHHRFQCSQLGAGLLGEGVVHGLGGHPEGFVKGAHLAGGGAGHDFLGVVGVGQGRELGHQRVARGVGHGREVGGGDAIGDLAYACPRGGAQGGSAARAGGVRNRDRSDELLDLALACAEGESGAEVFSRAPVGRSLDRAENGRYRDTLVEPLDEESAVGCREERRTTPHRHEVRPYFFCEDMVLVGIHRGGGPARLGHVAPISGPFYHPGPPLVGVVMTFTLSSLAGLLVVAQLGLATAADDDFDLDLDDDSGDDERDAPPATDPDGGELDADPDDDEWLPPEDDTEGEEIEFDDDFDDPTEDGTVKPQGPGEDTAKIYREALTAYSRLAPDEEALAWERYLRRYPNSIFKSQIDSRIEELSSELYEDAMFGDGSGRVVDAAKRQLHFAQPMLLESIDPRTKLRAGFEWGYRDWVNLMVDYEYAFMRELSAHVGVRQRFTGYTLEAGPRYSLIKSTRMGLLVTGIGDVRANFNPGFAAFRPQLGVGKRFRMGDMHLDTNLQGGYDLVFYDGVSPRLVGGANVSLAASDNLRIYIESSTYMKGMGAEQIGSFRFNQVTFGMKFLEKKSKTKDKFEAGFGASAPYSVNYWRYHYGAIAGDVNMYLE